MIKALIIEDEQKKREMLAMLVQQTVLLFHLVARPKMYTKCGK